MDDSPRPATGKFIVFEGARGSGKTTCLRAVAARLRAQRPDATVVETREPTEETPAGKLARRILRGEEPLHDPRCFQALAAADRLDHVALTIGPALARGKVVLCDRYVLSSVAFAPVSERPTLVPFLWEWVASMNDLAPRADLTLVLHVDPTVGDARGLARDGRRDALAPTALCTQRFYTKDSMLAHQYAHSHRVAFLDGSASPDVVANEALREVLATLDEGR